VSTPKFTVVVVWSGPIFAQAVFAPESVRVTAGEVSLLSPEGQLLAKIPSGASWRAASAAESAETVPTPATRARPARTRPSLAAVLDGARAALARGNTIEARGLLQHVLKADPGRRERADAELFIAESYLIDQDIDRALKAYRAVAASFTATPEGEEATFAVGQVLYEHGRAEEAELALRAYLAGHPAGRFAREAEDHLAALRAGR
jgi:TolA-binding protein